MKNMQLHVGFEAKIGSVPTSFCFSTWVLICFCKPSSFKALKWILHREILLGTGAFLLLNLLPYFVSYLIASFYSSNHVGVDHIGENNEFQVGPDLTWCPTRVFCEFASIHDLGFSGVAEHWVFTARLEFDSRFLYVRPSHTRYRPEDPIKNVTFQFLTFFWLFLIFPFFAFYAFFKVLGSFFHLLFV